MNVLEQVCKVNIEFPVVSVLALKALAQLTPKQLDVFLLMVQSWDSISGISKVPVVDAACTKQLVTGIVKHGHILKKIDVNEDFYTIMVNPSILICEDFATNQAKYDSL